MGYSRICFLHATQRLNVLYGFMWITCIFVTLCQYSFMGWNVQCMALLLEGYKVWTKQATCKQPGLAWHGSCKVEPIYGDKFTVSTCSWAAALASTWGSESEEIHGTQYLTWAGVEEWC